YALLVAPATWIFSNAEGAYASIQIFNAAVTALMFVPLALLVRELFGEATELQADLCAFLGCAFPAVLIHAGYVASDNLFTPVFVAACFAFWRVVSGRGGAYPVALGIALVALCATHPRGVVTALITVPFLGWLAVRRPPLRRSALTAASIGALGSVLVIFLQEHRFPELGFPWESLSGGLSLLGGEASWAQLASKFGASLSGQLWYLAVG